MRTCNVTTKNIANERQKQADLDIVQRYLTARYYAQELYNSTITLKGYIDANKDYALHNLLSKHEAIGRTIKRFAQTGVL